MTAPDIAATAAMQRTLALSWARMPSPVIERIITMLMKTLMIPTSERPYRKPTRPP
jgi:hypothetical protein